MTDSPATGITSTQSMYDPLRESRQVPKASPTSNPVLRTPASSSEMDKPDPVHESEETTLYAQVLDKATNVETSQDGKEGVVHVMYMGETFNLTHLLRQVHAQSDSTNHLRKRHYVVNVVPKPRSSNPSVDDESILTRFLRQQGAFTVPPVKICHELFRAYFDFVHPHYPILDRSDFAAHYVEPSHAPSYLLLQSVLFMASGHCELPLLKEAGFASRYEARKVLFQRAKVLYDNDHEQNKVTVVQSVFLMSFWWNGLEDHKDTWHWLGISISLALTLGMHRSTHHSDLKPKHRVLWKRIWWSLFVEDKHAAVALGRPVHIRRRDCDIELLTKADFEEDPASRPDVFGRPAAVDALYVMALADLSMIAETIVEQSFTAFDAATAGSADMFHSCSEALDQWKARLPRELHHENTGSCLWTSMLHVAHSWFEIVTHRSITPQDWSPPSLKDAHNLAMRAANRMIRIVEDLLSPSRISQCPIHIVPALFAAMGMQAVDICSGDHLLGQLGGSRTRSAMLALQQLQGTWPVSGWIFHLFKKIVRRIQNQSEFSPSEPVNPSHEQIKSAFSPSQGRITGVKTEQQADSNGSTPYMDANISHLYAMSGFQPGRYLFQNMPNVTNPMVSNNPADWPNIYDDGGTWGEFEYEVRWGDHE
ncbi:hypothetical protein B0A52_07207 [Exophiala mesophila]|uniref:Xylanolytic transcriptional activator regulatory domain-containing protein n=1 Tax=Exophiala mesophila TaxID=212818 RepID=A0A438N0H9_EXOME|nr:hypothetical protein B0A52_07207 [Exophiala mesophila]